MVVDVVGGGPDHRSINRLLRSLLIWLIPIHLLVVVSGGVLQPRLDPARRSLFLKNVFFGALLLLSFAQLKR